MAVSALKPQVFLCKSKVRIHVVVEIEIAPAFGKVAFLAFFTQGRLMLIVISVAGVAPLA